jgi:hypothetical protein
LGNNATVIAAALSESSGRPARGMGDGSMQGGANRRAVIAAGDLLLELSWLVLRTG